MRASIVSVGDELLIGQVVNTNAAWLGEFLSGLGINPVRIAAVGDVVDEIVEEIRNAFRTVDAVIITGGLGPTHDDVTRDAVADFLGVELHFHESWFRLIEKRFSRRGMSVPERNRSQALVPEGVEIVPNDQGTAPGFWRLWKEGEVDKVLVVMPGVPFEMEAQMRDHVAPRLRPLVRSRIRHVTLRTAGIGESHLQEILTPVVTGLPDSIRLAYLPSLYGVRLRVSQAIGREEGDNGDFESTVDQIRRVAADYIYGEGDDTLGAVVGRMLNERGLRLGTAESCTGGSVCDRLTDVPGASAYVAGGVIAYCNGVKVDTLGVDPEILERDGAVSEEVARQMAVGALGVTGADVTVSSTGILGPSGGTRDKPVGTVWIACAVAGRSDTQLLRLGRDRLKNKRRATAAVLNMIRLKLKEWYPSPTEVES
ncbi:MAG: competence/damage-inducible protein A [Rhodothermia bacterium]|nr:competence/damage-inducible protein A [Rhodothermia bacterium]